MKEIWIDIPGYEGKYQVSNTGKIKSFAKNQNCILKPHNSRGYLYVGLCDSIGKKHTTLVHRLVAKAFVPNPHGYSEINHKDEDKLNNNAQNLEWCTREYNMAYGNARLRQGIACGKPVEQIAIDGSVIAKYCSAETASALLNIDASSIHKCCRSKRKYAGGYKWRYITCL